MASPKKKRGGEKKIPKKLVMKSKLKLKDSADTLTTMQPQMPRSNAPVFRVKIKKKRK